MSASARFPLCVKLILRTPMLAYILDRTSPYSQLSTRLSSPTPSGIEADASPRFVRFRQLRQFAQKTSFSPLINDLARARIAHGESKAVYVPKRRHADVALIRRVETNTVPEHDTEENSITRFTRSLDNSTWEITLRSKVTSN